MSTRGNYEESKTVSPFETKWAWKGGAIAGFVATVAMGLAISAVQLSTLRLAIAGLYGLEGSLVVGWIAHLAHGTLFGIIFAGLMADPGLFRVNDSIPKTIIAAVGYGLVLAIAGAGIVMPIWLGVIRFPTPPSIPNVTPPLLVWHAIYGVVLGSLFPFVDGL
ncbi:histidine kinase [Halorussus salinisoli]|uniref:histidine kinase n=1 Tax=Halorussus salinisoli TaxID=2558242 RepID=UPI0010C15D82|nr:histidine kinase [Halorussus salinisoli]